MPGMSRDWEEDVPECSGCYFSRILLKKIRFPGYDIQECRPLSNTIELKVHISCYWGLRLTLCYKIGRVQIKVKLQAEMYFLCYHFNCKYAQQNQNIRNHRQRRKNSCSDRYLLHCKLFSCSFGNIDVHDLSGY